MDTVLTAMKRRCKITRQPCFSEFHRCRRHRGGGSLQALRQRAVDCIGVSGPWNVDKPSMGKLAPGAAVVDQVNAMAIAPRWRRPVDVSHKNSDRSSALNSGGYSYSSGAYAFTAPSGCWGTRSSSGLIARTPLSDAGAFTPFGRRNHIKSPRPKVVVAEITIKAA